MYDKRDWRRDIGTLRGEDVTIYLRCIRNGTGGVRWQDIFDV